MASRSELMIFLIGIILGSIIVLSAGLMIYSQRYSGVVCMPEEDFQQIYDIALPFLESGIQLNFTMPVGLLLPMSNNSLLG